MSDFNLPSSGALFSINLTNFRSYSSARFEFNPGVNFICAPNGSGKTNLLEAVSLLSPGRGLRKANSAEMIKKGNDFFSISAQLLDNSLTINYFAGQKSFSWNGGKISGLELIEEIGIFWLTPQIIFNFWKEPKVRRDFIDRIVANFIPNHLYHCAKYESIRSNRKKLIRSGYQNKAAYESIEKILAEEGINIIKNRKKVIEQLNEHMNEYKVFLIGAAEECSLEDLRSNWLMDLEKSRFEQKGKFGTHNTNIVIEKDDLISSQASTGQQHMMIINLVLISFIQLKQQFRILLLDDILSHLDPQNQSKTLNYINSQTPDAYVLISDTHLPEVDFPFNKIKLNNT